MARLVGLVWGAGPDATRIPAVIIGFALVALLVASLVGRDILDDYHAFYSGIWVGTLAGLLSALIMSMLVITHEMNPSPKVP